MKKFISDQEFKNYNEVAIDKGEYDNCTFVNCNFVGGDLSDSVFVECFFENCDLSNCKIRNSSFRDVNFEQCKMIGLHFDECNPFLISFNFSFCMLNFSTFYKLKIKGISFDNCKLEEVDFTECEMNNAIFNECDLLNSTFDHTVLEGADLRSARNFSIDPELNKIYKAKFSKDNISGLLHKYNLRID